MAFRSKLALLTLSGVSILAYAQSSQLLDPPVFKSSHHELDLLFIAKAAPIKLGELTPRAWIYEVCPRAIAENDTCPQGSKTVASYGGVRLELQQGDHLKMRLVNRLPPAPIDAKHVVDMPQLANNPTNLHTHGLVVEPRKAGNGSSTYGDYVYVIGYPEGKLPTTSEAGLDITDRPIDYDIYIPLNHPSGLFWFHPHVHGLALNQMSEGLSGLITVGSPDDYVWEKPGSQGIQTPHVVRHLMLKDMEVARDSSVVTQEDSGFCNPDAVSGELPREGYCAGVDTAPASAAPVSPSEPPAPDYSGGKWFFSINGQVYPEINVKPDTGEIWRMQNGSGSRTYDLSLNDDSTGRPLSVQVLALDGVSLNVPPGTPLPEMEKRFGMKFHPVACGHTQVHTDAISSSQPVCASSIRMMPSARVELWISPQQADRSKSATLMTHSYLTGPAGDDWPAIQLAHVKFHASEGRERSPETLGIRSGAVASFRPEGIFRQQAALSIDGVTKALPYEVARHVLAGNVSAKDSFLASDPTTADQIRNLTPAQIIHLQNSLMSAQTHDCQSLAPGHRRRIFFGLPATNPDAFGLGYEELDRDGQVVPGTFKDITEFDPDTVTVCVPLAEGNKPVSEEWELVNVSGEDHNFHIHQTKFEVLNGAAPSTEPGALIDNVPVGHGSPDCDGSIDTWRVGTCQVVPVRVKIPFSELGDFVYHCHILEHEDGGMMAHVRVVAHP